MESTQNLKKRIKSVGNINKITKAMELVAATKMRRSQEIALASRPYAFVALDLLANISLLETKLPELLKKRKVAKTLFVLVASDKGLAGAFNSSLFRRLEKFVQDPTSHTFVAVGEKAFNYLSKNGYNVVKKFTNVGDFTATEQVWPLSDFLVDGYLKNPATGGASWDRVVIFSSHFKSALKQEPLMRVILPISFESIKNTIKEIIPETGRFAQLRESFLNLKSEILNPVEYTIEPSPEVVLENLVKHLLFMQIYQLILEANASEHSARRLAMKTASDNASELGQELNLQYNKSRQAGITNQIIEITAGAEAQT